MKTLFVLLRKDLLLELRNKHVVTLLVLLSLLLSVVLSVGVSASGLAQAGVERIFPALWWATFIFSATLSFSRGHEYETEEGAVEAALTAGVSPALLFSSKCIANCCVAFAGQCSALFFLSVLLNVDTGPYLLSLAAIGALVACGYASLATLLVGMSAGSGLKHLLLPLVLLPLLTPLFMGASELTLQLVGGFPFDPASGWVSLLVGADVVYFLAGLNLYGFVLKE